MRLDRTAVWWPMQPQGVSTRMPKGSISLIRLGADLNSRVEET
jgi:hypothetical protein